MVRILSIVFVPLIYFYGISIIRLFRAIDLGNNLHIYFLLGFIGALIIVRLFLRRISFFITFEHELTHNLWAILTFNKPTGFHVEANNGGLFTYSGKGNFIITLSPYFFQTLNLFLLFIMLFIQLQFYPLFYGLIGFAAGYHLVTDISDIHLQQSDLRVNGLIFSFIVIILGNILMFGLILSFIISGWSGIWNFMTSGIKGLFDLVIQIF